MAKNTAFIAIWGCENVGREPKERRWGARPRTRRGGYDHIWGLRVAKERFLGVGV